MFRELHIFDFDGTIFHSPLDTPKNRERFELFTGTPWLVDKEASRALTKKLGHFVPMRKGWWGRKETLMPPLVPFPAPPEWFDEDVCEEFVQSKENPEALTVILTGRHASLRQLVVRILDDGHLIEVTKPNKVKDRKIAQWYEATWVVSDPNAQVFCLGEDGPLPRKNKPSETLDWKIWMCEQFLEQNPSITKVEFWEDREKHIEAFRSLHGVLADEVVVHAIESEQS